MVVRDEHLACRERDPSKGEHQRRNLARPERLAQRQYRGHDPITGAAMVPIAATEADSRASAANQQT